MLKISRQQALNRWDTLPQNLREALFSEYNSETLWKICEGQHLSEDKILVIARLAGDVIFGFIHPEDLAKEIRIALNLNPEIANTIAAEIDRKIFALIRADLEKVYSPAVEAEERELEILEADQRGLESVEADLRGEERPIPIEIRKPEPPIKIIGIEEETKPMTTKAEPQKIETGPLIIHKETEFEPLSESKKSFKSLGGLFGFLKKKEKPEEANPVKVEIEGTGFSKEIKKIKVVDYTEVPEKSPNNESGRIYEKPEPLKIVDSIRGTPEFTKAVEADKRELEKQLIITQETEQKPKKKFFSKLPEFFTKKAKPEIEKEIEKKEIQYGEVELPKVEETIKPTESAKPGEEVIDLSTFEIKK